MLNLDNKSNSPIYVQIYEQLRDKIIAGILPSHARLPSIRELSDSLNVSKNTIISAYEQLTVEGYILKKERTGYFVEKIDGSLLNIKSNNISYNPPNKDVIKKHYLYDFQYADLNFQNFPIRIWSKLIREQLSLHKLDGLSSYPQRGGERGLKEAIQQYLNISRGVNCHLDQIVICPGTQACLNMVCKILEGSHQSIAMEDPGYDGARNVIQHSGYKAIPISLDQTGMNLNELENCSAKIAYITPSHQFPMGYIMPINKRIGFLKWAINNNAYIIEDDYDSEFKYTGRPIPSIQSIDTNDRVIYMGTFSKSLSPALRISYLILPTHLVQNYDKAFHEYHTTVPWLDQRILELFIKKGYFQKHLRKILVRNKLKHDLLIKMINKNIGKHCKIHGSDCGLHILLEFNNGLLESDLISRAEKYDVKVHPMSQFWIQKSNYKNNMVMLGFSGLDEEGIIKGVNQLELAWL